MAFWLFKTEPDVFSIQDLQARGQHGEIWDGVRNYQARNMLRDDMRVGDKLFIYHSNTDIPGISGIASVVETGVVDPVQFDPTSDYHDPRSAPDNPRWITVRVKHERTLDAVISLAALKAHPGLQDMRLVQKGNRLSILPVTDAQWTMILAMA